MRAHCIFIALHAILSPDVSKVKNICRYLFSAGAAPHSIVAKRVWFRIIVFWQQLLFFYALHLPFYCTM